MTFEYVSVQEARAASGLRMVVVGNVPSPWGEAAKGLLHLKKLPFKAVRLAYDDPELKQWAGQLSGPVLFYEDEPPRSGWAEILLRLERLAPSPALLPTAPFDRATALGLCHELMGEEGLAWTRRLQMVDLGLRDEGGFKGGTAKYLAKKYLHTLEQSAVATERLVSLLGMYSEQLLNQQAAGRHYYLGDTPTAVDVYSAAAMAALSPLPEEQCAMRASTRSAFESMNQATRQALHPVLLAHRDRMYTQHLELPLHL